MSLWPLVSASIAGRADAVRNRRPTLRAWVPPGGSSSYSSNGVFHATSAKATASSIYDRRSCLLVVLFLMRKDKRSAARRGHGGIGAAHRAPDYLVQLQIIRRVFLGEIHALAGFAAPGGLGIFGVEIDGRGAHGVGPQVGLGLKAVDHRHGGGVELAHRR